MHIATKNYVYSDFLKCFVAILCYNKSIKKSPTKSFSLCLSNNTPKGAYLYVYYTRIKDKAGTDLE